MQKSALRAKGQHTGYSDCDGAVFDPLIIIDKSF